MPNTVKVSVSVDELWPFYELNEQCLGEYLDEYSLIEIPAELLEDYKNTMTEFNNIQKQIKNFYYAKFPERVKQNGFV